MTSTQFSLSWDSYQRSICTGLSVLQQNGEFVDMTLAADGHHVKVHQLVMSLVSPYIKDLISSAQCPHPVIFLNQISYKTLCSILEYIYTGQAVVAKEDMQDVLLAANALHLKGFDETDAISTMLASSSHTVSQFVDTTDKKSEQVSKNNIEIKQDWKDADDLDITENPLENRTQFQEDKGERTEPRNTNTKTKKNTSSNKSVTPLQYTLSNQGTLQLILNRFIYYSRYTNKGNGQRRWQCVEYVKHRCPAVVFTKDDVVMKRLSTHTHPFHDRRIMNKVKEGFVFSNIQCAEDKGKDMNNTKKAINNAKIPTKCLQNTTSE